MKANLLITLCAAVACTLMGNAQTIKVIDRDGLPVPYAAATTAQGKLIGSTDVNGVLDAAGNKVVCLSHVAFAPLTVNLDDVTDGTVVMEDAGYAIPDVVVKPKEMLYVQTYYRMTYIDDDGPIYYRAGTIDNTYEFAKEKINTKSRSISEGANKTIKFLFNLAVGRIIEDRCKLQKESTYQHVTSGEGKWANLTISTDELGRQVISDAESVLGYIEEDKKEGTRTVSFDNWLFKKHLNIANEKNEKKKEKKQAELEDKEQRSDRSYYEVYRMDEDGRSAIGDFVMQQILVKGVTKSDGKAYIIILESFATETDYIDKKEFKQTRKDNEVDRTYHDYLQYEKAHNIPPLAPHLKEQVDKLFAK